MSSFFLSPRYWSPSADAESFMKIVGAVISISKNIFCIDFGQEMPLRIIHIFSKNVREKVFIFSQSLVSVPVGGR